MAHFFILLIAVFLTSVAVEVQLINFFLRGLYLGIVSKALCLTHSPPKFPPLLCSSTPSLLSPPSAVFQALGPITAVPVTGPQVSSLQRLAGQGAAVLPQVSGLQRAPGCLSVCLSTAPQR